MFARAECYEPLLHEWIRQVAVGQPARLLVLGPGWSGKTHTAWAALNALRWKAPSRSSGFVDRRALASGDYQFEELLAPSVIIFDVADYGDPEHLYDWDGLDDYTPVDREVDEPEVQADLALQRANVNDAATRVSFTKGHSLLFTATSASTLQRALGEGVADRILAWPTIALPRRPRPSDVDLWG